MIITSACRGVALATSKPNLDQSYFAEAVLIISMAQQLVPNTSGHREFDLAQLITSSSLLISIPPEGVGCTSPGKAGSPPEAGIREEFWIFEESLIIRVLTKFPFGGFRGPYCHFNAPFLCAYKNPIKSI